jgi:thiol peroxidase
MGKEFPLVGPELKPGEKAPDFEVVDSSLQKFNLAKTGSGVRIFSVVPSLDTPVCDAQTKRFEEAAGEENGIRFFNVSMDLPFAQTRWCGSFGIDRIKMLSDHMSASFGQSYGTLIPDLRIESRAIFVLDSDDRIVHAEYVRNVSEHPDYEAALSAAKAALKKG